MKRIIHFFILLGFLPGMGGCYDLQGSYDYHPENATPYLHMSVWEFIESRQDIFTLFKESVEHVDAEFPGFKDYYTQTTEAYTYLLLTDDAFGGTAGLLRAVSGSSATTLVSELDPAALRDALLYLIVEGRYHGLDISGSLNFAPINVITLLKGQDAVMTLQLCDNTGRDRFQRLQVNYQGGSVRNMALTSNLIATNGIAHVFDFFITY